MHNYYDQFINGSNRSANQLPLLCLKLKFVQYYGCYKGTGNPLRNFMNEC